MKKIISISRRTDIPAFYGDWFMHRLESGFAGCENPFSKQKIVTSLKTEDVSALVFWSKNFRPFLRHLKTIKERNIPVLFNYTITGLPRVFECNCVEPEDAIDSLKELSRMYSPEYINWRYDPVIISDVTDEQFHLERFRWLSGQLKGYVTRCLFSFVTRYGKVMRNFRTFRQQYQITVTDPDRAWRTSLAGKLADIAEGHGIRMFSCCGDYLQTEPGILKAHCVDGALLKQLYPDCGVGKEKPVRPECGCTASSDIGRYDTCPHGCIYCYANINKERAIQLISEHDPDSAFLGYAKNEADQFLSEIKSKGTLL
ncbi:MAG: DUF1848 domain-containing protein [Desulfuromonadaceae bacterium]|nr:DUF1848 domain-containing protein [Desulfuromonadaceae bacterium]MDD5106010.1 DUF1848 domain-containing protein [Desulfuromonadaceae bacterium]